MAGTTPKRALPYPGNADVPDIAGDIQDLATAVDTQLGTAKTVAIATSEARTNAAYGTLTTPDQLTGIVVPANALVEIGYQAQWFSSVSAAGRAAIFIGANQLKIHTRPGPGTPPQVQEASTASTTQAPLATSDVGLACDTTNSFASTADVTTGQILSADAVSGGGYTVIKGLPAATYTFSIQFKSATGSVTALSRQLWVYVRTFQ